MNLHNQKYKIFSGILIGIGGIIFVGMLFINIELVRWTDKPAHFDSQRAFMDVEYQVSLGPRTLGSEAHLKVIEYIQKQLKKSKWNVEIQETQLNNHPIRNVIAKRGNGTPWIIFGAHFDTRLKADRDPDPDKRQLPVPGANDGASGVAILLELGRVLPKKMEQQVWLVFFDAEDNGGLMDLDWIMGSRAFVDSLDEKPGKVIIVDMVGDADLGVYMEKSSNQNLREEIWKQAAILGYNEFIPTVGYAILDDHTPFLQAGIPAIDIIDFQYPYWHTTQDTLDKVSHESLGVVGETLLTWFLTQMK